MNPKSWITRVLFCKFLPRSRSCHFCVGTAKNTATPLVASGPGKIGGLDWYFNSPWAPPKKGQPSDALPASWVSPNRDVNVDPQLHAITMVTKITAVKREASDRKVLPHFWQLAFDVSAVLCDAQGGTCPARINLQRFIMNPIWAKSQQIRFVKDWLAQSSDHLDYVGEVFQQAVPVNLQLSLSPPRSPSPPMESTVVIEEAASDEECFRATIQNIRNEQALSKPEDLIFKRQRLQ